MAGSIGQGATMKERINRSLDGGRQFSAVLTAFMLPMTTTGTAIALTLLIIFSLLTINPNNWRSTLQSPAVILPVAIFALLAVSMLWSPHPFGPGGASHYAKLLLIPIIMGSTYTKRQAMHVAYGFAAACIILLLLSLASLLWHAGPWGWFKEPGIPVKDNAVQSTCFSLCAFGLGVYSIRLLQMKQNLKAVFASIGAIALFADVFLITLSKTGIVITLAFTIQLLAYIDTWRCRVAVAIPLFLLAGLTVTFSSEAQLRVTEIKADLRALKIESFETEETGSPGTKRAGIHPSELPTMSTASRLDFWRKAIEFIGQSPIIGHGAGSTKSLYASLEKGRPSPYGEAVPDPHNQFLAIVIQTGLAGGALLLAMWIAHLHLFWGAGIPHMLGRAVVIQNVLGSLFNSQLSQVTQGTLYCLAVGLIAAVIVRRPRTETLEISTGEPPGCHLSF